MEETIGSLAAILTTASFLPQVKTTLTTRDTSGLSLTMYVCFTIGIFLWMIYGIALRDMPIFLANFITLISASLILSVLISNTKAKAK